ncbi:MAG: MOSC domain-containing protein [Deltaproteobacteria bacterium]|nr:MOSC domain-containing protein [Deltaproteobacteria bacterium]
MSPAAVASIFRHPVKGLRPEALARARLDAGRGVAGDRAFAFQFLDDAVPPELRAAPAESAPWMSKFNLVVQHDWPELARIVPAWDAVSRKLRLERQGGVFVDASVETAAGRRELADFIHAFLATSAPYEKARHGLVAPLRLIGAADLSSRYTDGATGPVTLATEATFADLASRLALGSCDARRFRLNLILGGAPAWSELGWVGKRLRVGGCVLEILKPVGRCANIDVNPVTGARDADIYPRLKPTYGHALTGVRAEVVQPGEIRLGDSWCLEG